MMSFRAYAKHRGCRLSAVQRAIESGRIAGAVVEHDGKREIDEHAADRLWVERTRPRPDHPPTTPPPSRFVQWSRPQLEEELGDWMVEATALDAMVQALIRLQLAGAEDVEAAADELIERLVEHVGDEAKDWRVVAHVGDAIGADRRGNLSLRQYAAHRNAKGLPGGTPVAVDRAVRTKVLDRSVVRGDGESPARKKRK